MEMADDVVDKTTISYSVGTVLPAFRDVCRGYITGVPEKRVRPGTILMRRVY